MLGKIASRLTRKWRIGSACSFPAFAMTRGTGRETAAGISFVVEHETRRRRGCSAAEPHRRIIVRNGPALVRSKFFGNKAHLGVVSTARGIVFQLPLQVSGIEPSQSRRSRAIPAPVQTMASEAGIGRTRVNATMGNDSAVFRETVERTAVCIGAANQHRSDEEREKVAHGDATIRSSRWFRLLAFAPLIALTAACKPPPDERQFVPGGDAVQGKAAIERAGCGSCHTIPGIAWPKGKVGPELDGLAGRALIAGQLPNRPDLLAQYIRNAPSMVPGSAMPAMPVSRAEARDIAAYLYEKGMD